MKDEALVKAKILMVARQLIQQYGMNKTTMLDIAKAAGKGKSSLYYYFKSKEEIFDAVIRREMLDFFTEVKRAVVQQTSVEDKLRTYIITKVKLIKRKLKQFKIIIDKEAYHFDFENYFQQNRAENDHKELALIQAILQEGVSEGIFDSTKIEKANGQLLAELILTAIRGIEVEVYMTKDFKSLNEKAALMTTFLVNGLK